MSNLSDKRIIDLHRHFELMQQCFASAGAEVERRQSRDLCCALTELTTLRERLAAAEAYRTRMEEAHSGRLYAIEKLLDHFDEEGNLKGNGQWRIREIWQCCKDFDEGSERAAALKPQPQDETAEQA